MPFIWSNPEGGSFSSMTIDDLTVNNSISWGSAEANKLVIDTTDEEAFLVRKDSDGGDVFVVDTNNSNVNIPAGANLVLAKGSTTQGRLQFGESGAHFIMRYDTIVGASRFSNALVLQDEVPNTYMAFDSASQDVEFTDGDVYIGSGSLLVDTIQSTSADGTISFTDQTSTIFQLDGATNVLRMPNGRNLAFGDANNFWLVYDVANTQLEMNSTDIDGGGTNGLIFVIPDGEQKFQIAAGSEIEYLGTGSDDFRISTPSNNIQMQAGSRVRLVDTNLHVQDNQFVGFGDSEDFFIRYESATDTLNFLNATGTAEDFMRVDNSSNITIPNGKLGIGLDPTGNNGNLQMEDSTDNSATAVVNYDGGIQISNSDQTTDSYTLMKFNHGANLDADGAYIQAVRKGNNLTALNIGQYDNGGNSGTPYIQMDESYNVTIPNGNLIVDGGSIANVSGTFDINSPGTLRLQNSGTNKVNIAGSSIDVFERIDLQDGMMWSRTATGAANYQTSGNGDVIIIGVDDLSAPRTVTIDSDDIARASQVFIVKDEAGNASGNNITVATEGAETIDGAASLTINTDYDSAILYSDGTNLFTT